MLDRRQTQARRVPVPLSGVLLSFHGDLMRAGLQSLRHRLGVAFAPGGGFRQREFGGGVRRNGGFVEE